MAVLALAAASSLALDFSLRKREHSLDFMMPARDGVGLHTIVHFPREKDGKTKFPAVVDRSPYGMFS